MRAGSAGDTGVSVPALPPLTHQRDGKILSNALQLQGHSVELSPGTALKDCGDKRGREVAVMDAPSASHQSHGREGTAMVWGPPWP